LQTKERNLCFSPPMSNVKLILFTDPNWKKH